MKIDLKKYYEERERLNQSKSFDGPVITISREYGCEANRIARLLVNKINERPPLAKSHSWKYITKEILEDSARELGINPSQVEHRIQQHDHDPIQTIFNSLGQHYDISDHKIIEKVNEIMLTYARKGNVIIIGRGGSVVTRNIERALRVRLVAPLDWRAKVISRRMSIDVAQAVRVIKAMDQNRTDWVRNLADRRIEDAGFDLFINVKSFSDQEIMDMILHLMEKRGYIALETKLNESRLNSLV